MITTIFIMFSLVFAVLAYALYEYRGLSKALYSFFGGSWFISLFSFFMGVLWQV
jgi:hypothetical protein